MRNKVDVLNVNNFNLSKDFNNNSKNEKNFDLKNSNYVLPSTLNVTFYLKLFLLFFGDITHLFKNDETKREEINFLKFLAMVLRVFTALVLIRGVLLVFNDHDQIAYYLGNKNENDAWKHITLILLIYSIYTFGTYDYCFRGHSTKINGFTWLEPFQVIGGLKSPNEFGLTNNMAEKLLRKSRIILYSSLLVILIRCIAGVGIFFYLYNFHFNHLDEQEMIGTIWIVILGIWNYFNSGSIYILAACFDILNYYFQLRFQKVNSDIDFLIDLKNNLESKEKHALLHQILHEHNHLCKKVEEYNKFWSKFVMYLNFIIPFVCLYCLYQTLFVNHTDKGAKVMFIIAWESFFIFTKTSLSSSKMSYIAHFSYYKLMRVTLDDFPIDLRFQLRILIQRLSGPTISFYCSDLFELSHKSYYHMILGLSQNFFLLVDFIQAQNSPWLQNSTTVPLIEYTTPMIEDFSINEQLNRLTANATTTI